LCDQLGTDPKPEEVPLGIEDFPVEIQEVLYIYGALSDRYAGMSGTYLGKDFNLLPLLFSMYNIDCPSTQREYFTFIRLCDNIFTKMIREKEEQKNKLNKTTSSTPHIRSRK